MKRLMIRALLAASLPLFAMAALAQAPGPVAPAVATAPQLWRCANPISPQNGIPSACVVARSFWTATEAELFRANGDPNQELVTLVLESTATTGGTNEPVRSFGKTTYLGSKSTGVYNAMGQHVLVEATQNCFAVGDCLIGSRFLNHANGVRDSSDEGAHLFDTQVTETPYVPTGRCAKGCTHGSELVSVAEPEGWGQSGEGRFLGDITRSVIGPGEIVGASVDRETGFAEVEIAGGTLPVSTLLKLEGGIEARIGETDPGGVTVAVATTGLPRGYAGTTLGLPTHGVLCLADMTGLNDFEMAPFVVLDATHLGLHLRKQHNGAVSVAVGGTCGLGVSLLADEVSLLPKYKTPVRQVIPVYGSRSPTTLLMDRQTHLGQNGSSNAFFRMRCPVRSAARRSGTVSLEVDGDDCWQMNGLRATVSGTSLAGWNAPLQLPLHFERLTVLGAVFTASSAGADASAGAGGMVSFSNGAYRLVPIAETLRVLDPETGRPDGSNVALAPNLTPFAPGDALEQFHWHLALTGSAGEEIQTQYTPEMDVPTNTTGVVFASGGGAITAPGKVAFRCSNAEADAKLLGYGGTHLAPWTCLRADGAFRNVLDAEWITNGSILRLHPLHHEQRNATPFWLLTVEPGNGDDAGLRYIPETHALEFANMHAAARTWITTRGTPKSAHEACTAGETWDAVEPGGTSYHYFCRVTDTIVRVAMQSF